jgi:hypothetical protein
MLAAYQLEVPMALLADFDPASYVRLPNLDLASFVALGHQLLTALPGRPVAALKASGQALSQAVAAAQASLGEHLKVPDPGEERAIDQAADVSWGSLFRRLDAYAELPADRYPKAGRAARLRQTLFPTGLGFVNLEYGAQWTAAEQRLKLIHADKLKSDIEELAGADFYAELTRCHAAYGELVGATKAKPVKSKLPDLRAERLRLQQALTAHAIQLVATVLAGGDAALEAAQPSFAAIDAYRDKASTGASASDKRLPADPEKVPGPTAP